MMVPAVQAAKAVGKPVKVIYSRENDMTMDFSRPLTLQKVKAGLRRRRQADRAEPRRGQRVADQALGNPRFPHPLGRPRRAVSTASP